MSELIKDVYNKSFYDRFSNVLKETISTFDKEKFKSLIFNDEFEDYELKQRMTHTTKVLNNFLPSNFEDASQVIIQIIKNLKNADITEESMEFMFLPQYIELYGIDDYDNSVLAFEFITSL